MEGCTSLTKYVPGGVAFHEEQGELRFELNLTKNSV